MKHAGIRLIISLSNFTALRSHILVSLSSLSGVAIATEGLLSTCRRSLVGQNTSTLRGISLLAGVWSPSWYHSKLNFGLFLSVGFSTQAVCTRWCDPCRACIIVRHVVETPRYDSPRLSHCGAPELRARRWHHDMGDRCLSATRADICCDAGSYCRLFEASCTERMSLENGRPRVARNRVRSSPRIDKCLP